MGGQLAGMLEKKLEGMTVEAWGYLLVVRLAEWKGQMWAGKLVQMLAAKMGVK